MTDFSLAALYKISIFIFIFLTSCVLLLLDWMYLDVSHDTAFSQQDKYSKVQLSELMCPNSHLFSQVGKDTLLDKESIIGPTPLPADKKLKSQSMEGVTNTSAKKTKA